MANSINKSDNRLNNKLDSLKIIHWNCNGIKSKLDVLTQFLNTHKPDIMSLNEIKLSELEALLHLKEIAGSKGYFKCRNSNGGGVCILINRQIDHFEVTLDVATHLEIVGIQAKINGLNVAFLSYYNPPYSSHFPFRLDTTVFEYIEKSFQHYLLLGDLNAKSNEFNIKSDANGTILDDVLCLCRSQILNNHEATNLHIRQGVDSRSVIDYGIGTPLFSNSLKEVKTLKKSILSIFKGLYFHLPMLFVFKLVPDKIYSFSSNNRPFLYEKANWEAFRLWLDVRSTSIGISSNLDSICSQLSDEILNAANEHIPKVDVDNRRILKLPLAIRKLVKLRNYWQKRYKRVPSEGNKISYKLSQAIVQTEISNFRNNNWRRFLARLGKNPLSTKPLWRRINRMKNKKNSSQIGPIVVNGITIEDDKKKADAFADKLQQTFTPSNNSHFKKEKLDFIHDFIHKKRYKNSTLPVEVKLITFNELNKQLKKLSNKTSPDQFGISYKMLKNVPNSFKVKLLEVFNECLRQNKIPIFWKSSMITMIPKKSDDPRNIKNFRPISITSCLMRLFERIIQRRLNKFLKDNDLLVKWQSGFRSHRQTHDNLIYLIQKTREQFNLQNKVVSVFFDIESAFDKVWHEGLLFKLVKIGLPIYLIEFLSEYLSDRTFQVKVGGMVSDFRPIACGVPQGGVLSPKLFSCYINDIPLANGNHEFSMLFADDLKASFIYDHKKDNWLFVEQRIQHYLNSLESWANEWRLTFSPAKTKYIIFSRNKKTRSQENVNLRIYNTPIESQNEITFLGYRFDRFMSFSAQISYIKESIKSRLNILKIVSHSSWQLDNKTLLAIYSSTVRSIVDYSFVAYAACCETYSQYLDSIQDMAIRILSRNYKKLIKPPFEIKDRMRTLLSNYFLRAITSNNQMFTQLLNDYIDFKSKVDIVVPTPLCKFFSES